MRRFSRSRRSIWWNCGATWLPPPNVIQLQWAAVWDFSNLKATKREKWKLQLCWCNMESAVTFPQLQPGWRIEGETDHNNLHLTPTLFSTAFTSFILPSLWCFPSQHFNHKSGWPWWGRSKQAWHQAQVTISILVITLHSDFIDSSEINLILYSTKESWMWRKEEEEEIPTCYVSRRKDFSQGNNNVWNTSLSRSSMFCFFNFFFV